VLLLQKAERMMPESIDEVNVATISDEKVGRVYALIEMMPDRNIRTAFLSQMRQRLRCLRPIRRITPLRLFCQPIEMVLCDDLPKARPPGYVPRSIIQPLWSIIEAHLPDRSIIQRIDGLELGAARAELNLSDIFQSYEQAAAEAQEQAERDRSLLKRGMAIRPDFWDIVRDIVMIYKNRHGFGEAKVHILASRNFAGIGEYYGKSVAGIILAVSDGGRDRQALLLFVVCLMLDPETAPYARIIIESLASEVGPGCRDIIDDLCVSVAIREGEQIGRLLRASVETPAELLDTARSVQLTLDSLQSLRNVSLGQGRHLAHRVHEAQGMLREFLDERFLTAIHQNINAFSNKSRVDLPSSEDVQDLSNTVLALSKIEGAAQEVQLNINFQDQVEMLRSVVHQRIASAMDPQRHAPDREKQTALSIAAEVARSLEPVCSQECLLAMLEECAGRIGLDVCGSREQFLMSFIHFINSSHPPGLQAASL
jgi:hypothetical protein